MLFAVLFEIQFEPVLILLSVVVFLLEHGVFDLLFQIFLDLFGLFLALFLKVYFDFGVAAPQNQICHGYVYTQKNKINKLKLIVNIY